MSADFPRLDLLTVIGRHGRLLPVEEVCRDRDAILRAVDAYDALSERCVMDAVNASLEIANLRARLREIDPSFPKS